MINMQTTAVSASVVVVGGGLRPPTDLDRYRWFMLGSGSMQSSHKDRKTCFCVLVFCQK